MAHQEWAIDECLLEICTGDITDQEVDAIVNAANSNLAGGGGVDGAIHRAGGSAIMKETVSRYPDGCLTGSAVISGAGNLNAKYVIHAVGPPWYGGNAGEPLQLARAIVSALDLARSHECQSVAFPAISTGVYGYPKDQASRVALKTTIDYLKRHGAPKVVRFVLWREDSYQAFHASMMALTSED